MLPSFSKNNFFTDIFLIPPQNNNWFRDCKIEN